MTALIDIIRRDFGDYLADNVVNVVKNPEWEKTQRVHDWRNYIDDDIVDIWSSFSLETRLVAWMMAKARADSEEWD